MKIPAAVLTALRQHQSFLTHTHTGPDPDSFGATLALKIALEEQGKVVTIFGEDKLIPAAYFLPGSDQILQISLSQALATYPFDCYISLDTASASMISKNLPPPEIHAPFVNLDHHPDNTLPKQLSFIDPAASSACEVLFQVLTAANIPISPSAATCLLFRHITAGRRPNRLRRRLPRLRYRANSLLRRSRVKKHRPPPLSSRTLPR